MNKKWIKPLVLAIVFIGSLVSFSLVTNKSQTDMTTSLAEATLPVVSFSYQGTTVNELFGYVNEMVDTNMRGNITPVGDDRMLHIVVDTDGVEVSELQYEIRSMDGTRLVVKNATKDFSRSGNQLKADVELENILQDNEEYALKLTLQGKKQPIYYYTRVIKEKGLDVDKYLNFALDFHSHTFARDEDGSYFANYVENATGDATNLGYVDLTCTVRQIKWRNLICNPVTPLGIAFQEINDDYTALTIRYILSTVTSDGENQYYDVEEYYRLRQGAKQMYVLDYERTAEEIFNPEGTILSGGNSIQLGITPGDVEYDYNEVGNRIAFVQAGELWGYDASNNLLSKIFSFREQEDFDPRDNLNQHDIKIMNVDEAGSVDFIVFGYMNRGKHEGEVGLSVFHYDGLARTVEEEAYLPCNSSYGILGSELGQFLYESDGRMVYLVLNHTMYSIDLNTKETKEAISNLTEGDYFASVSNRYFTWIDAGKTYQSETLHLIDLSSGKISDITVGNGEVIRPMGFIGEDLIYGVANASDVVKDAAGNAVFPTKKLYIVGSENTKDILKEYAPSDGYVGTVTVDGYLISMQLIQRNEGQFVVVGENQIMNKEADKDTVVYLKSYGDQERQKLYQIAFTGQAKAGKTKLVTSKEVITQDNRAVEIQRDPDVTRYYVYAKGDVLYSGDQIATAIRKANENNAIVVNQKQQYVWQQGRSVYKDPLNGLSVAASDLESGTIVQAISGMIQWEGKTGSVSDMIAQGNSPEDVLVTMLPEYEILNLSGCSVDEMFYYVNNGTPVFALTSQDTAVLLTGYTSSLVYYYDPATHTTQKMATQDANNIFSQAGNVFLAYQKN